MKNLSRGFTIVELLIVIIVIAILASVTVVSYNGIQERAEYAKAQSDLKDINDAVQIYKSQKGKYPIATMYPNGDQILDTQWGAGCDSNSTNNGQYHTSFLNSLVDGGYLDKMPVGTCIKAGKHFTYYYASNSDGSEYKLLRTVVYADRPLPSIETSDNPLINPADNGAKISWGYWSANWANK